MTIRYQLTEDEIVLGQLKHGRRSRWRRWLLVSLAASGVFLLLANVYLPGWSQPEGFFVLGEVAVLLSLVLTVVVSYWRYQAELKGVRSKQLAMQPIQVEFDKDGLVIVKAQQRAKSCWSDFSRMAQDHHYIYLCPNSSDRLEILPSRAFDETSLAAFREYSQSLR